MTAKEAWEKDAEEFGRRFKFGEWDSALRVARSVYRGRLPRDGRASVSDFAARSKVADVTVRAYHNAWELAAKDGLVPSADDLIPGHGVPDLPTREAWDHYFRTANPARTKAVSPRQDQSVAAAAAIADAVQALGRAVHHLESADLDAPRKANVEIMFREAEAVIAEGRSYIDDEDFEEELAALLQAGA